MEIPAKAGTPNALFGKLRVVDMMKTVQSSAEEMLRFTCLTPTRALSFDASSSILTALPFVAIISRQLWWVRWIGFAWTD
jgi:hypothetical protein